MRHARLCLALGTSLLAAVGALVACGDFSATDTPATPEDEAGATNEASTDAPVPDALSPIVDGGGPVDAANICDDAGHWICDDFDHDGALGPPRWEAPVLTMGGTVAIASVASAPSPPNVLTTTLSATAGAGESARVEKHRAGTVTAIRCDFDLAVPTVGDAEAVLFELGLDTSSGAYYRIALRGKGGPANWYIIQTAPLDGGSVQVEGRDFTLVPTKFSHVSIQVATAAGARSSVKIDGMEALGTSTVTLASLPPSSAQYATFGMASVSSSSSAWAASFDNVVCDVDP